MKRLIFFLAMLSAIVLFVNSCSNNNSDISGTPDTVLDNDVYDKLQKEYNSIFNFEEGTAIVIKNYKMWLINSDGKNILQCTYDTIYSSISHTRIVKQDKKFGLVSSSGKFIIDCNYDEIKPEYEDVIAVKQNSKWGVIDLKGKQVRQFKYDKIDDFYKFNDKVFMIATYNKRYGAEYIDGTPIVEYNYDNTYYLWNDFILVIEINKKSGLVNLQNNKRTDCLFENKRIFPSENGYLTCKMNGKCGALNARTFDIAIPFEWDDVDNVSEGVACVKKDYKYGYVDTTGKIVIPLKYSDGKKFSEGVAMVAKTVGKALVRIGYIDKNVYGFIDHNDNIVIPFKFCDNSLNYYGYFKEGLAPMGIPSNTHIYYDYMGYINKKGDFVIEPKFEDAGSFHNGIACVTKNDKIGFIDTKGNFVIPCEYDFYSYIYDDIKGDTILYLYNFDESNKDAQFDTHGKPLKIK